MEKGYAIIRGGCSGAGRELSMRLAAEGYDIVGNFADKNMGYKGDALIKDVQALGVRCIAHNGDLRSFEAVKDLFETAQAAFGENLAVFVNNGGIFDGKRIDELEVAEYEELAAIHLCAMLHCVKLAVPVMKKRGGGVFVNVTSVSSAPEGMALDYTLEKDLFSAFTCSLAKSLEKDGVRFNSILSAMVPTPGDSFPLGGLTPPAGQGHERMMSPFFNRGTTDELADCLSYIVNSRFMTGQLLSPNLRL